MNYQIFFKKRKEIDGKLLNFLLLCKIKNPRITKEEVLLLNKGN